MIEPGAEGRSALYIIWMESMTTTSGFTFLICSMILARFVSARMKSSDEFCVSTPSLCARRVSCCSDSSEVT